MFLRRPRLALTLLVLAAAVLLYVANRYASYDTAPDTVVDPGTVAFQHEVDYEGVFGADPLVVLISGDVGSLFNSASLQYEIGIEGGLAQRASLGVQSVYGPASIATVAGATIQNVAAGQLTTVMTAAQTKAYNDAKTAGKSDADATTAGNTAAQAAGKTYIDQALKAFPQLQALAPLQASNPKWMDALFINPDTGKVKPRFAAVTPDSNHIVVTARLSPDAGQASVTALVDSLRAQLKGTPLEKTTVISGVPVLEAVIARGLRLSLYAGMLLGVISMGALLLVALRRRGRLLLRVLPLAAGLATVFILAGLVTAIGYEVANLRSHLGIGQTNWQSILATFTLALNPATLAAFPIALGLSVDYAVQFLYRYTQAVEAAADEPWQVARRGAGLATRRAAICTVGGLMALLISTIPMVRQFGVVMSLGVVVAWTVARLTVLSAVRAWPQLAMTKSEARDRAAAVAAEPASAAVMVAAPSGAPEVDTDVDEDVDYMLFGLGASNETKPPAAASGDAGPANATPLPEAMTATPPSQPGVPSGPPPEWEPSPWDPGPESVLDLGPRVAWSRAVLEPVVESDEEPVSVPFRMPEPTVSYEAIPDADPETESEAEPEVPDEQLTSAPPAPLFEPVDPPEAEDAGPDQQGRIPALLAQFATRRAAAILVPALLLAMVGWVALPFSTYESDPQKLVSPNLPALQDLHYVSQATGSAGELDFILLGPDVTSDVALQWTKNLQAVAQRDSNGKLKPLGSLNDLVVAVNGGTQPTADKVQSYLQVMPTYFTDALVDRSHRIARVAFGVNLSPVAEQKQFIDKILADVEAPAGYTYYPAGFNYLTVRGLESLQSGQLVLNIVGAGLVLLLLFAIYRRPRLALMAWAPTLFVAGWSTAVLFAIRVPLTPMTAVLGALVVAFGTEFAILWLERYREALASGLTPGAEAAEAASRAAGPGIILSGGALALGFLALAAGALPGIASFGIDLPVVRDFGLVATMDMILAVAAALLVLPAIVVRFGLAEGARSGAATEASAAPADAAA